MNRVAAKLKHLIWIPSDRRGHKLREEIRRPSFLIVLAVLLLFGDWLGKNVVFDPPSQWFGDILLRTRKSEVPRYTRYIRIDDTDREEALFGKTPVDGPALLRAVCAIAASQPTVIVVDLDTSSERSFPPEIKDRLPDFGVPVVWAVNADWEQHGSKLALKSGRFLGGKITSYSYGIARMPIGFDGVVRGWFHTVDVNGVDVPSLTQRAVDLHSSSAEKGREPSFAVNYLFPEMHLRDFVSPLAGPLDPNEPVVCSEQANRPPDERLKGMVAVLGAVHPTEDRHETPWGSKPGAELVAMSIEESLHPHTIGRFPWLFKLLVKVFLALAVAALHHYFWPIAATLLTVLLLPLGVLLSGCAVFWYGDYHLAAVPLIVGILLEQLATSAHKGEHFARTAEPHS